MTLTQNLDGFSAKSRESQGSIELKPNTQIIIRLQNTQQTKCIIRTWAPHGEHCLEPGGNALLAAGSPFLSGREIVVDESTIHIYYQRLVDAMCASSSALIPVRLLGPGSSDLSRKIRVSAVYENVKSYLGEATTAFGRKHSLTIPFSQLSEHNGLLYAPRWLLVKTIEDRSNAHAGTPSFDGVIAPGAENLWNEIFAPLLAQARLLRETRELHQKSSNLLAEASVSRIQSERERGKGFAEMQAKLATETEKRAEKKRENSAQNRSTLATIRVTQVEWDYWVRVKNKWGGKSLEKSTGEASNCLIQVSGQRIYILLPGGYEVISTAKNVRYKT